MRLSVPRRIPLPLFGQILLWLVLNLVAVCAVMLVLLGAPGGGLSLEGIVSGPLGDRPKAIAGSVAAEVGQSDPDSWTSILARYTEDEGVQFTLFRPDGRVIAGEPATLPLSLRSKLILERRPDFPADGPGFGGPPGARPFDGPRGDGPRGDGPRGDGRRPPAQPPEPRVAAVTTDAPTRYWFGVRIPLPPLASDSPRAGQRPPALLVAHTESWYAFASFTGLTRTVPAAAALFGLSALLWWPLVRSISKTLRHVTDATEAISQGRLDTRVEVTGRDELTRLSVAVNHMAGRLQRFVEGERRFMGDIAHELTSPLARAQMALSLLERHVPHTESSRLTDVREEIEQMSALVGELLAFSKASLAPRGGDGEPDDSRLETLSLAELAHTAVARERAEGAVTVDVGLDLRVRAAHDLLLRAASNLVRNAVRYAAGHGPITLSAEPDPDPHFVLLHVTDAGPGVPEGALARLGDPFYRPDTARTRESGGVGLGLAIVRTAVEACGGTVAFSNRSPQGFRATLRLRTPEL